ncbi:RagB/SusD family nutrient uptake outer membrane protein [Prevotellamassilia timonensis]|nr:RagB/SusD family nutrient uptake outer membrane protein [Prevotellamassilia timonensis]
MQPSCPPIFGLSDSQTYQLLWPIPYNELMTNPSMTQNPGY